MEWYFMLQDALGVIVALGNIRLLFILLSRKDGMPLRELFLRITSSCIAFASGIWLILNIWSTTVWIIFLLIFAASIIPLRLIKIN